jgi:cobalt/nickel transport system permease protein
LRSYWLALGLLLALTPLGILAGGTAWGEWQASDFADPVTRDEIAAASFDHAPPASPPEGLERLSSLWTAPLAGYTAPWVSSPAVGYALSAMFGTGVVILISTVVARALRRGPVEPAVP